MMRDPWGVVYEPARSCFLCAGAIPAPCLRLVARAGEACVAADDLLLHRLQPDPGDQAPDPAGARRRVQRLFDCDVGGAAGWKSSAGNRQSALHAPFRRCADDPARPVQECDLLAVRFGGAASRGARSFPRRRRPDRRFSRSRRRALFLGAFLVNSDLVDGAISFSTS